MSSAAAPFLGQRGRNARQQRGAGSDTDPARGPLQQAYAQALLKLADGLRDGRWAHRQRGGGRGEAAQACHADEGGHGG
ncbi:hypothetical protein OR16_31859 [Cupriavidus basilensis OR16]|uniref:Uncharacterized protein n=1 Tax=Cupriavidus basilensis OR16 TaxID=1127483 RepID=H1SDN8_9BURK|nr:hypothetical protein [Cupriavidus basilensis]EHP39315.1 hypothetical protein OR16_31859 [Cupriavidus basilensis OR16]